MTVQPKGASPLTRATLTTYTCLVNQTTWNKPRVFAPRAAPGPDEEAAIGYSFSWHVLLEYKDLLLRGLAMTVKLSILGFLLSAALGVVVGVCRLSSNKVLSTLARLYVEFFRNVPLVVQIFFLYFGLGMGSFAAGLLGIVLYSAPYIAEIIRSGIASIPRAQFEAAHASGLRSLQVTRYV